MTSKTSTSSTSTSTPPPSNTASPQLFYFNQPPPSLSRSGSAASSSSRTSRSSGEEDSFYFSESSEVASTSYSTSTTTTSKTRTSAAGTATPLSSVSFECTPSCQCTKCCLGDFVFDNAEEYMEYLALVNDFQRTSLGGAAGAAAPAASIEPCTPTSEDDLTTPLTSPELDGPPLKAIELEATPRPTFAHSPASSSSVRSRSSAVVSPSLTPSHAQPRRPQQPPIKSAYSSFPFTQTVASISRSDAGSRRSSFVKPTSSKPVSSSARHSRRSSATSAWMEDPEHAWDLSDEEEDEEEEDDSASFSSADPEELRYLSHGHERVIRSST